MKERPGADVEWPTEKREGSDAGAEVGGRFERGGGKRGPCFSRKPQDGAYEGGGGGPCRGFRCRKIGKLGKTKRLRAALKKKRGRGHANLSRGKGRKKEAVGFFGGV